jgi:hypothetical protein
MGAPKFCLGYPSRTAAVMALRAEGVPTRVIASRIGIEPKTVTALEASAQRDSRTQRRETELPSWHTVAIDNDVLRALRPHALRRGLTVTALARQLLATLADDDLVDALLDDADEAAT